MNATPAPLPEGKTQREIAAEVGVVHRTVSNVVGQKRNSAEIAQPTPQAEPEPQPTPETEPEPESLRRTAPDFAATLDEVAGVLGLSRERVRQIEARALRKLRHALERRGIGEQEWIAYLESLPTTEREW